MVWFLCSHSLILFNILLVVQALLHSTFLMLVLLVMGMSALLFPKSLQTLGYLKMSFLLSFLFIIGQSVFNISYLFDQYQDSTLLYKIGTILTSPFLTMVFRILQVLLLETERTHSPKLN